MEKSTSLRFLILLSLAYSCVGDAKKSSAMQAKSKSSSLENIEAVNNSSINSTFSASNSPSLHTCLISVSNCNRDFSVTTGQFIPIQSPSGNWSVDSCLKQVDTYYNRCHDSNSSLHVIASYYENGVSINEREREYEAPITTQESVMLSGSFCMMKINACPNDPSFIPANSFFYITDHSANFSANKCETLVKTLVNACNVDNTKLLQARAEFIVAQEVKHIFEASNVSTYLPSGTGGTGGTGSTGSTGSTGGTGSTANKNWWKPGPINSWDIRLDGGYSNLKNVEIYIVDLFDVPKSAISSLKNKGTKVICYFSAGSYEDWRPDKGAFPSSVKGKNLDGWAGEKWLDVRKVSTLRPIMAARMDLAKSKGCHAVDPDNVDGYTQDSGFSIKASDQINYNKMLAEEAHKRGLAIGLKNNLEQVNTLEPYFDFAVNEQCFQYNECSMLDRFISKGKAVFGIEYELSKSSFCSKANKKSYDFIRKRYDLKSWVEFCR